MQALGSERSTPPPAQAKTQHPEDTRQRKAAQRALASVVSRCRLAIAYYVELPKRSGGGIGAKLDQVMPAVSRFVLISPKKVRRPVHELLWCCGQHY